MGCGINCRVKVADSHIVSRSDSGFLPGVLKNYIGPDIETLSGHDSLPPASTYPLDLHREISGFSREAEVVREENTMKKEERDRHSPALAWVEDYPRNQKGGRPESVSIDLKFHFSSPTPFQETDSRMSVNKP